MKLKSIKIDSLTYPVIELPEVKDKKGTALWGKFSSTDQKIYLDRNMPTEEKRLETLFHEVLHAIWHQRLLGYADNKEETVVYNLTNGLVTFFKDNPKFLQLLQEVLN